MNQIRPRKIGGSFKGTCRFKPDGVVTAIPDGMLIAAAIMTSDGVITPLEITINPDQVNNIGIYTFFTIATTGWSVGRAMMDIVYSQEGVPDYTDTIFFEVVKSITPLDLLVAP